ncbi:MAG: T9SS type A sorting domain-containing protein [Bacteroidia bacterium]
MKKIAALCIALIYSLTIEAQTIVFHENMEVIDSVNSLVAPGWFANTRLQVSGLQSDSASIILNDTCILETISIDLSAYAFASLQFKHICKVHFFDGAIVQVFNGTSWVQLAAQHMMPGQPDSMTFANQNNNFSDATYVDWLPAQVIDPTNAWWKTENFNISSIAGNVSNVKIRWVLMDLSAPGGFGKNGWFIDDIVVAASTCEMFPPSISLNPPVIPNNIYYLGPFTISAQITDASGINPASVMLHYSVNGGIVQDIPMSFAGGNIYTGIMPAVNDSDSVCYFITANDNSACANPAQYPAAGCVQFTAYQFSFPYCDNFDSQNNWTDTSLSGTPWQLGTPSGGFPSAPHSAPNVWEVGLTTPYLNNSNSFLVSPQLSFSGVYNAQLSCWLNFNTEQNWDGVHLEYSLDSINWLQLGTYNDPNGSNWYNFQIINCNGLPGWSGNSGLITGNVNGWIQAEYSLSSAGLDNVPYAWLRFNFCSDAIVTAPGFAIDDFCITIPAQIDAGVKQILSPSGINIEGTCLPVIVKIKNYGQQTITQVTVSYTLNGGSPVSQIWNGSLAPGATVIDTFPCFNVPPGTYSVCAYTTLAGDSVFFNDTSCVTGFGIPFLTAPVCDDFETGNGGFYVPPNLFSPSEWQLGTPNYGVTTGAHSGTKAWDINLNSPYAANARDTLYSAFYNVSGASNPSLSFWQKRYTTVPTDGFFIEYSVDTGLTWQQLGTYNDPNALNWYNRQMLTTVFKSAWDDNSFGWIYSRYFLQTVLGTHPTIQFRFIFVSAPSGPIAHGVTIDDFCISIPSATDAGVTDVLSFSGNFLQQGQTDSVVVGFRNYGSSALTSVNIYFKVNNGSPVGPYAWNGNLAPGASVSPFILSGFNYTIPAGTFNLCAWTSLTADGDHANDTLCSALHGLTLFQVTYASPYCDSYDSLPDYWNNSILTGGSPSTIWQRGMPAYGATTGTHTGANAWDINLTTTYFENADVALYSPLFEIPLGADAELSFWQNRNTENNWDGTRLEYTINGGLNWIMLGLYNDTAGTNWYNSQLWCSNMSGWAGNSNGWKYCEYRNLSVLNGQTVQFRFVFCSDASVILDGISIDDFCINIPPPLSASANSIAVNNPVPLYFPGQCLLFKAEFGNSGTVDITTLTANLFVDGNLIDSDVVNFSPPLVPGAVSPVHIFSNCWTAMPGIHTACVETSNPNGSADLYPNDDSLCTTFSVVNSVDLTSGIPYCQDFETQQFFLAVNSVTYSNVSSWKYGSPSKTYLSGAYSGLKAWVTSLTGNYPPNDQSALISPVIILNSNTSYNFSFWTKFKTEFLTDGGTLQYSTDYATSWNIIGNSLDPQWMNSTNIIAINPITPPYVPGWSGTNSAWEQKQHLLCFPSFSGSPVNVIFRFLFMSDIFTQDEGWEIEDLCIAPDATLCTVGIEEMPSTNGLTLSENIPNPFNATTKITFGIPSGGFAEIKITNLYGMTVSVPVSGNYAAGMHTITIQKQSLAPGIHFYSLTSNGKTLTRKMIVSSE